MIKEYNNKEIAYMKYDRLDAGDIFNYEDDLYIKVKCSSRTALRLFDFGETYFPKNIRVKKLHGLLSVFDSEIELNNFIQAKNKLKECKSI